jgi:hypothetical protein
MEPTNASRELHHPVLGRIRITSRACAVVTDAEAQAALARHLETHRGKFTFLAKDSPAATMGEDSQLLSSHRTGVGDKFWILTHTRHRTTTAMLQTEY